MDWMLKGLTTKVSRSSIMGAEWRIEIEDIRVWRLFENWCFVDVIIELCGLMLLGGSLLEEYGVRCNGLIVRVCMCRVSGINNTRRLPKVKKTAPRTKGIQGDLVIKTADMAGAISSARRLVAAATKKTSVLYFLVRDIGSGEMEINLPASFRSDVAYYRVECHASYTYSTPNQGEEGTEPNEAKGESTPEPHDCQSPQSVNNITCHG